jgi:amino acid transporter
MRTKQAPMRRQITTIRFLLVITAIVAVMALMTGYLVSTAYGNAMSLPPLIFISMIAPLAMMTAAYWFLRIIKR